MDQEQTRRDFLGRCAKFCGAGCALLALNRLSPSQEGSPATPGQARKPIDVTALTYCGIPKAYCEKQCELFKATRDNDVKLKKAVYEQWGMKASFGIDFDPDKIFCYGCKPGDKPLKVGMAACPVRTCPQANGLESCVQCANLSACDKDYWKKWPTAFESAKAIQARYKTQPGAVIKARTK